MLSIETEIPVIRGKIHKKKRLPFYDSLKFDMNLNFIFTARLDFPVTRFLLLLIF